MYLLSKIIIVGSVLVSAMGATTSASKKCEMTDNECKRGMYQIIFSQAAEGIPKLNMPPSDPLILNNAVSVLPNSVKLTLEDGLATGFKNCHFDQLQTYLEEPYHTSVKMTCNLKVNGKYKVDVPKSVMEELGGEDLSYDMITGSGNGKLILDNLHLLLDVPFDLEWRNNDTYFHTRNLQVYNDAQNTVLFSIEDLDIGHKGNSKKIADYLKGQAMELNLIAPVTEKILEFFIGFTNKYVAQNPVKELFTSDLSSYL